MKTRKHILPLAAAMGTLVLAATSANAAVVTLQNPTATNSKASFEVAGSIDGLKGGGGWFPNTGNTETAVYETTVDLGLSNLSPNFYQRPGFEFESLRISVTQDDRSTFADGLANGGDVTATWTVLTPLTASGPILGDGSIDLTGAPSPGGDDPGDDWMTATTPFGGITGFRVEMPGTDLLGQLESLKTESRPK